MLPFSLYKVKGRSMLPTLSEGTFVLTWNYFNPKVGDIVIARDPRTRKRILKRITNSTNDLFYLAGDNPKESTDSRTFGLLDRKSICGKIVGKF